LYNEAISSADKLFNDRDFTAAKETYTRALQLKQGDAYASQRISAIEGILADELVKRQKQTDDSFKGAMERGTKALAAKNYPSAKSAFQEALAIKPSDISAGIKLAETETLIKQEQERITAEQARRTRYEALVAAADEYFLQKDFQNARTSFQKALDVLPNEHYPRQKLDEINAVVTEQERITAEQQANEKAYNLALTSADKYFKAKDFIVAREEYSRALKLKPDAVYPKNKLAEMEDLIRLRQKEQDEAKARADAYAAAMNAGNAYFGKKEYSAARISYQDALKQLPGDVLATDQIKKIDNLLADANKQKQAETARKATFDALIKSADIAYGAGNYALAKEDYKKVLAIEPTSAYAKQRIAHIDEINRALSQAPVKTTSSVAAGKSSIAAAIPMGELIFKTESERQKYLDELKKKYPAGITLEKYREHYKETYRYIVIRENQAQEFRQVTFTTYSGAQYSVNGKPITQQYFLSQIKPRQGEDYQEIEIQ
jgi:tetratricopeptide (TPR) repeat protein